MGWRPRQGLAHAMYRGSAYSGPAKPVWGKSLITGKPGEWFILRVVEMSKTWFIACAGAEQGFGDKDTYGETWVAYRRPPERERGI